MRILCTGDLHLGRTSTKIPDLDHTNLSCAGVWDQIVSYAVGEQGVDLVLISGDLVDRGNRLYEGNGALRKGIARLAEAGIHTFAVAGNHDFDTLPAIIRDMDSEYFHQLGIGGKWEAVDIEMDGIPLRLVGWSFPENVVSTNPLHNLDRISSNGELVIGILHADTDISNSRYAPVSLTDLRSRGDVNLWLLGHIHVPNNYSSQVNPIILNPGSPQAMHPEEPGVHGPWILEVNEDHSLKIQQIPMSTVMYQNIIVNLDGYETGLQCQNEIIGELENCLHADTAENNYLKAISCRIRLEGETDAHSELPKLAVELKKQTLGWGETSLNIESFDIATSPKLDLNSLAQGNDALVNLARILVSIENGSVNEEYPDLLENAAKQVKNVYSSTAYSRIRETATGKMEDLEPNASFIISCLRRECRNMIATLRGQEPG